MSYIKASDIREMLKVTEHDGVISFAGGLPAPELFPIDEIEEITRKVLKEQGGKCLNYAATEGYTPLREWIADRMNFRFGTSFDKDNIMITNGSQQALDLSGKVFLDEGDVVLCESPTYLAALGAFRAYGCRFIEIPTDDEGMIPESLEEVLKRTDRAKLVYVNPEFQNPTGRTWSLARRKRLAELAAEYNVAVIEDNPYGELRFEGEKLPSIQSFDKADCVMYTGTFSKIFCPGFRIGWVAGHKEIIRKYVLVKQGADLQCNPLSQSIITEFMQHHDIDAHIAGIVGVYKRRRDVALRCIAEYFPDGVRFTHPEGGLFIWAELPKDISARELLAECLEKGVAFVPGGSFFPNENRENTMRLNFSNMPDERIETGMRIIGETLGKMLTARSRRP